MKSKLIVKNQITEAPITALPPELIIQGPKLPRHLAVIPKWINLEQVSQNPIWSDADDVKLLKAVSGTSPAGREIIQRVLWKVKKMITAGQPLNVEFSRPMLNSQEFALLERIMVDNQAEAAFLADNLWRIDYRSCPPSMEKFLTNSDYLGPTLDPKLATGIWPCWFKTLCENFDRESFLNNIVLTGAIGTGKTTMMVVILLYRICLLLLLKRPAEMFEQGAGSTLYFVIVSVTREAAQQTAFSQAVSLMTHSNFFRNHTGIRPGSAPFGGEITLARADDNESSTSVRLLSGSKEQHLIGRNVIGVGFDEGNARLEKDQDEAAFELYEAMRNRVLSRLKTRKGYLPGITIIASSARDESSVTEQVKLEIEASGKPEEQRVFQKAIYEVKPLPPESLKLYFKVAYGQAHQEPTLLPGVFDENGNPSEHSPHAVSETLPLDAKTVLVPDIYLESFKRNCRQALQDICGISCGGSGRLFPTMADVDRCLEISAQEGVPRTWSKDEISISSEDKNYIWDFLDHRSFLQKQGNQIMPLRHPDRMRYAHIDLATQSFAGLAICHLVGEIEKCKNNDAQPFYESRLVVEYDLIIAITPGKTKPINFEKIQNLFLWLKEKCGFTFGLITADQYQSEMPLQMLEAKGIHVGRLSIDRDKTVYRQWRSAFEEHRVRLAHNERMYREASRLIEVNKKYDHPPNNGTKDVTDAAAGAYFNAVNSDEVGILGAYNTPGLYGTGEQPSFVDPYAPPITITLQPYSQTRKPRQFDA